MLYVSGYTDEGGEGVYRYEFQSGQLIPHGLVHPSEQASYFCIEGNDMYVTNEVENGYISHYRNNQLTRTEMSGGSDPCHVLVEEGYVFVTNYTGGSVTVLDTTLHTLQCIDHAPYYHPHVHPRQEKSHPHSVHMDPTHRYVIVCDLGCDQLVTYRFTPSSSPLTYHTSYQFPDGTGPRQLVFAGSNSVYVLTELSNEIYHLTFSGGRWTQHQKVTVSDYPHDLGAEIQILGHYVYASIRGSDVIAVYRLNEQGQLQYEQKVSSGGSHPRHFIVDPTGEHLLVANKNSNSIAVLSIDPQGHLHQHSTIEHPQPTCIQFE